MRVTSKLILFLLLTFGYLQMITAQVTGQKPEAGKTYYLYNVYKKSYVTFDDNGKMTLSGLGSPLTLSNADENTEGTFFMTTASGNKVATSFLEEVSADGTGEYDHWIFRAIDANSTEPIYAIGCRIPDAGTVAFLYWSDLLQRVIKLHIQPASNYTRGQWMLVSQSYYEENVITLDEASENYTQPTLAEGSSATVRLKRNLTLNSWNSLCLPFCIDKAQIESQFGEGTRVAEYTGCTETTLKFTSVDKIEAGKPYLVNPTKSFGTDKDYYEFTDVSLFVKNPSDVIWSPVTYKGYFYKTTAPKGAYVLRKNVVYHLVSDMPMKGFRAYFLEEDGSQAKIAHWTLDDGETTGIDENVVDAESPVDIYQLDGRLVRSNATSPKGLSKGVYIVNGKKVIMK